MRTICGTLCLALLLGSSGDAVQAAAAQPECLGPKAQGTPVAQLGAAGVQLILDRDFPDPFIARFGDRYVAYGTGLRVGTRQLNVQRRQSQNLKDWSELDEALPDSKLPAWVDKAHPQVWAPEVMQIGGRYVLYFNARHATLLRTETGTDIPGQLKRHCLGVAVSDSATGEFTGLDDPLVCAEFEEGVIDAGVFRDGESLYLFYKYDGNCCGRRSAIYVQGLSADGLAVLGPRHKLIENSDSPGPEDDWEWRVVEAPTMVKRGGRYYLFYSGNHFGNINYSVGYLECETPRGPCRDKGDNPIVWSHPQSPLRGPGHQSVLDADGANLMFFHGWDRSATKSAPGQKRCLYVSRIDWTAEGPRVVGGKPPRSR